MTSLIGKNGMHKDKEYYPINKRQKKLNIDIYLNKYLVTIVNHTKSSETYKVILNDKNTILLVPLKLMTQLLTISLRVQLNRRSRSSTGSQPCPTGSHIPQQWYVTQVALTSPQPVTS